MAKLVYSILTSLDGYAADQDGNFDWAAPSEEVHAFINELERGTGTFLLGRRMYETLVPWETMPEDGPSPAVNEYGRIWRAGKKIVYSTTLSEPTTKKTTIEHEFIVEAIRRLKSQSKQDLSIGGPHLAAEALRAGLVDELQQFIAPVIIGNGNHWLPKDIRVDLQLVDMRKFESAVQVHQQGSSSFVYLHYKVRKK